MMGSRKKALREYVVGFLEMATFDAAVEASRYLCTSCRGKEESDTCQKYISEVAGAEKVVRDAIHSLKPSA
jgi:hypothetical protein